MNLKLVVAVAILLSAYAIDGKLSKKREGNSLK